jgi:hypothetical protein
MSSPESTSSNSSSYTLFLLALAASVFLGAQLGAVQRGSETMRWQQANSEKQIESLKDSKKRFAEAIVKRDEQVKQSGQVQTQYTALFNDLLDLSKTDEDAKKVVQKWGIQRQAPTEDAAKPEEKKASETK